MEKEGPKLSPNEPKRGKNERYKAASQPKTLSLLSAKRKATKFAAKNDKRLRVGAKRAILRELNSHLVVKAQGIFPPTQSTSNPYGAGHPINQPSGAQSRAPKAADKQPTKPKEVYTWNRNGRQEELKIRYVARKYLLLWIRKVYGRLHPHLARAHYQYHLKVKVMKVWQDIWWSGRKGWKLTIRAEYHDRYRMWAIVWRRWRVYTLLRRAKKDKLQRAFHHSCKITQGKYIKVWKEYVKCRRLEKEKVEKMLNTAALSAKRWAWLQWVRQMDRKREHTRMEHTALKYWAINLLAKGWACWIIAWNSHQVEKKKMVAARTKANMFLVVRVWKHWRMYHSIRRLKAIKTRVAQQHYFTMSAISAFKTWKARWKRQRQLAQFDQEIILRGNLAWKRRIFNHWQFYITLQYRKQAGITKAANHYLMVLKRKCLHCLGHHRNVRHHKYARQNSAQEFWCKLQLTRVWRTWLRKCDHSEELKIYPLTKKARSYHRFKLLNVSMHSWQLYWKWRKHKQVLYSIADKHYSSSLLPRCLKRMTIFVEIMKEKREALLEADLFRREVLLAQVFYKWHHEYQLVLDVKMMNRMAILHHDQTIKTHYLTLWQNRTRQEVRQQELKAQADYRYEQNVLVKAIRDWKNYVRSLKQSRYFLQTASHHYYLNILRKVWSAWSKYVDQKSVKWRQLAIADIHYQHGILRKLLNAWKLYRSHHQKAVSTVNQKFDCYQTQRLRWAWSAWQHFAMWHRNKCILYQRAKTAHRKALMKKVLVSWHIYACQHALEVEEQATTCREKRLILNQGKLQRSFHAWSRITKVLLHKKALHQRSDHHHNKTLCRKSLKAWQQFVQLSFRIKLLHRQSQWLHNNRIQASFFRGWKRHYATSIQTRKKSSLSLWHWSVVVQRKAFHAWLQYAIMNKQKGMRIAQALNQRRTRLVKTGVTQWIKVAFDLASVRNRYAQARQVQQAERIQQYVYKCVIHWRKWTAQRKARKSENRELPATLKATSIPATAKQYSRSVGHEKQLAKAKPIEVPPDLFKERPKPRVPEYLRVSFDISSFDEAKDPLPPTQFNLVPNEPHEDVPRGMAPRPPPISGLSNHKERGIPKDVEETPCPRPPPRPCTEVMPHPRQRSCTNDSMAMLLLSDGEGDVTPAPRLTQRKTKPTLLPPSSFQLPARKKQDSCVSSIQDNKGTPFVPHPDVKTQIFEARKKLQDHYNMKLRYRKLKQQRDQLLDTTQHEQNSVDDLTSRQLTNLNTELHDLLSKIEQDKQEVEQVAINIQQLIQTHSKTITL